MLQSNYAEMGPSIHACWHSAESSTGQAHSQRGNQVHLHAFTKPHVTCTCFHSLHPECVRENELTLRLQGPLQTRLTEDPMKWELQVIAGVLRNRAVFGTQVETLQRGPAACIFSTCSIMTVVTPNLAL